MKLSVYDVCVSLTFDLYFFIVSICLFVSYLLQVDPKITFILNNVVFTYLKISKVFKLV